MDLVSETAQYLTGLVKTGYINESKTPNLSDPIHQILWIPPDYQTGSGSHAIARLNFVFKESQFADWVYSKDGWFRKRDNPGKGYGLMFRSMTRMGKPQFLGRNNAMIKQNVKITYLPSEFDVDDPRHYDTGTGNLWIDSHSLGMEKILRDPSTMDVDVPKLVAWIDKKAKELIWIP